jgi:hypothetical protein
VTQPKTNGTVALSTVEEAGHASCVIEDVLALPPLAPALQTRESLALDLDAVRFQDISGREIVPDVEKKSDKRFGGYEEEVRADKPLLFDLGQMRWSDLCGSAE